MDVTSTGPVRFRAIDQSKVTLAALEVAPLMDVSRVQCAIAR
ncbi:MAG: hypothetical protein ACJA0P_000512 [Planctomycetota bacterium]